MLKIRIEVPEDRTQAGFVAITDGLKTLIEDTAVATSGIASRNDGYTSGHPPLGRYALAARAPTPAGAQAEYGQQLLLFEPIAGQALEAESFGRFSVLLYAGAAGDDKLLRRTQGGVRLAERAMRVLLERIDDERDVELAIEILAPAPWWVFWRKKRTPPSLSRDPPRMTAPPHDEATLASELARSAIRRERPQRRDTESDDAWRDRDSHSSSSRESGADFRGAGGSGGGGGASGAWSDAPAAGRGPGVTAAGVIAGAAGAAAIAAAAAGESRSGADDDPQRDSTPADSGSADAADSGSSPTTGTAY